MWDLHQRVTKIFDSFFAICHLPFAIFKGGA